MRELPNNLIESLEELKVQADNVTEDEIEIALAIVPW